MSRAISQRVFLLGMPGAGKSYWANKLKKKLKLPAYDLDALVEMNEETTVANIFLRRGEEYFRIAEATTLRLFEEKKQFILSCGGGTPCFHENMKWMNEHGVTVWLDEPLDILHARLIHEQLKRPLITDFNKQELRTYLENTFEARKSFYKQATHHLYGDKLSESSFLKIFKQYA